LAPLAFGPWRSDPRLGRADRGRPGKRLAVAHRHAPDLDQLVDQRVHGLSVEVELALQRAKRDTLRLLEQRLGPADLVDEGHGIVALAEAPSGPITSKASLSSTVRADRPLRGAEALFVVLAMGTRRALDRCFSSSDGYHG
jgi:hypothetical protein